MDSDYSNYRVLGLPAQHFGLTYLVVATFEVSPQECGWEYYLISKRPSPTLRQESLGFKIDDDSTDPLGISQEALAEHAKEQALFNLQEKLIELYGDDPVADPFGVFDPQLQPTKHIPLLWYWHQGELTEEITGIRQNTQCSKLRDALELYTRMTITTRSS